MGHTDYTSRYVDWIQLRTQTNGFSGSYIITGRVNQMMYKKDLTNTYRLYIDSIADKSTGENRIIGQNIGVFFEIPNNLHIGIGDTIKYTGKIMPVIDFPLKGFAGYAWYHHTYGKSMAPIFQRISIAEPPILGKVQSWAK